MPSSALEWRECITTEFNLRRSFINDVSEWPSTLNLMFTPCVREWDRELQETL
jgi:hypothetical protein